MRSKEPLKSSTRETTKANSSRNGWNATQSYTHLRSPSLKWPLTLSSDSPHYRGSRASSSCQHRRPCWFLCMTTGWEEQFWQERPQYSHSVKINKGNCSNQGILLLSMVSKVLAHVALNRLQKLANTVSWGAMWLQVWMNLIFLHQLQESPSKLLDLIQTGTGVSSFRSHN